MRRLAALLLAGVLCLGLCACGEEPAAPILPEPDEQPVSPQEEKKDFALAYDPTASMHPITGDDQVNRMLITLVYEGLYVLDEHFAPQPLLAQGAEVDESGLKWTVTLAEGIRFSDGTPLEAGHVASSLNTARGSAVYGGRLRDIVSVRAVENTVVITLSEPNGALDALLDVPVVLEREEGPPLGTGRYRYAGEGESLYLLANFNREGNLPYETIALSPVTSVEERIAAFDSGAVSAVLTDATSAYALGYSCSYEEWDYSTTDLLYVGFKGTDGPCSVSMVRQAVSQAFDRAAIVEALLERRGDAAALPVSPLHEEWREEENAELDYDPGAAAELLSEAGYTRDEETGMLYLGRTALSVTLLVNSDNEIKATVADRLAENLTELGIAVTVNKLPWKDYLAALKQGTFDLYLAEVRLAGDFDVTELLSGSLNYGGYDSAPLAEQLQQWKSASGQARLWAAKALWNAFAEEAPFAPLCFKRDSMLVRWDTQIRPTPIHAEPFYGIEHWTK